MFSITKAIKQEMQSKIMPIWGDVTLAPINKLISGRVANLPTELQQLILRFACCHPCASLVRNNAKYISKFTSPFWSVCCWRRTQNLSEQNYAWRGIENGPSPCGPIVRMQPVQPTLLIPPLPPPLPSLLRMKKGQQRNLIKAQRKQLHRSQKSNNRLNKRQRR
jgi:hypothetical protein